MNNSIQALLNTSMTKKDNHITMMEFCDKYGLRRNTFYRFLREKGYWDNNNCPTDLCHETWFEPRTEQLPHARLRMCYDLTPDGIKAFKSIAYNASVNNIYKP